MVPLEKNDSSPPLILVLAVRRAMHQNWHYSCFVCTTCQKPFEGDYCTISNAPYCKQVRAIDHVPHNAPHDLLTRLPLLLRVLQDYYRKKGWLCAKCDKVVGKGDKSALGKAWHKGCFVCTTCDQPFGSAGFFNLGGRPYCPVHYREKNTAAGLTASGSRPVVPTTSSN
jgi:paxillin